MAAEPKILLLGSMRRFEARQARLGNALRDMFGRSLLQPHTEAPLRRRDNV
jgi:hypothetical protein